MKIKKFLFSAALVSSLACFLTIPLKASAIEFNLFGFSEKTPQTFSEFEAKNTFKKLNNNLLNKWIELIGDPYHDPRQAQLFLF